MYKINLNERDWPIFLNTGLSGKSGLLIKSFVTKIDGSINTIAVLISNKGGVSEIIPKM